jgi:hypothetical protein
MRRKETSNINHSSEHDKKTLNDVNTFIENERIFLEMNVLQKDKEANAWKQKYDTLFENVTQSVTATRHYDNVEVLVEIDDSNYENIKHSADLYVLDNWILCINQKSLNNTNLSMLLKEVKKRSLFPDQLTVIKFIDCVINEDPIAINSLVEFCDTLYFHSIDYSFNDLNTSFFTTLLTKLKVSEIIF